MKKKPKKLTWIMISIFVCLLFIPIIVFNTILSIKGSANPDKLPSVFGIAPTVVMTGSMSPEIEAKDLIFVKEVDADTLQEKTDIICFNKNGEFITHRIERIEVVDGVKRFYTKGDANNVIDNGYVVAEQIQGKYIGSIAVFGGVIMFLQNPYGLMLTVILVILLYIAGELIIECVNDKKEKKLLSEENKSLRAQLDAYAQAAVTQVENRKDVDIDTEQKELNIRYKYRRSFISRLIQSGDNTQGLYTSIKNYLLKYQDVKCRSSWGAETFTYKRNPLVKLCIKGKTLYAYVALSEEEMATLKIDEIAEGNKYSSVSAKFRVTGIIKLNRVKKAIDVICTRKNLICGEEVSQNYSYPYETDEQLMKKGLIKSVKSNFTTSVQKTK